VVTVWLSSRSQVELAPILQAGLILIATAVCQALRREPMSAVIGRLDGRWMVELILGALVGACLMLVPALVLVLLGRVEWQRNPVDIAVLGSGGLTLLNAALAEELLFRGFAFQRLMAGLGAWPAQLIVGGFFLLIHLDNAGMTGSTALRAGANIFLASLLLGMAFIRTRRLALPIGVHFMANFVQGCVLGFGVSGETQPRWLIPILDGPEWLTGGEFGLEASLPGLVAVAAATFLFYRYRWPDRSGPGFQPKKTPAGGRLPASPIDDG
jgi:hypothetical protein